MLAMPSLPRQDVATLYYGREHGKQIPKPSVVTLVIKFAQSNNDNVMEGQCGYMHKILAGDCSIYIVCHRV